MLPLLPIFSWGRSFSLYEMGKVWSSSKNFPNYCENFSLFWRPSLNAEYNVIYLSFFNDHPWITMFYQWNPNPSYTFLKPWNIDVTREISVSKSHCFAELLLRRRPFPIPWLCPLGLSLREAHDCDYLPCWMRASDTSLIVHLKIHNELTNKVRESMLNTTVQVKFTEQSRQEKTISTCLGLVDCRHQFPRQPFRSEWFLARKQTKQTHNTSPLQRSWIWNVSKDQKLF